jgi:hypothetical protein
VSRGKVSPIITRYIKLRQYSGNPLWSLISLRTETWLRIIEEVFTSAPTTARKEQTIANCVRHHEFICCCLDATVRVAMRVRGQGSYRKCKEIRNAAAIPDAEARRRVVSLLGRSGATAYIGLCKDEDTDTLNDSFRCGFSGNIKEQVLYIACDSPSRKLFMAMQAVFVA